MVADIELDLVRQYGKLAGLLYLVIILCGITSEVFVRGTLVDFDDANLTLRNILDNQVMYLAGFVLDVIMIIADIAIAVVFYLLFKPISQVLSLLSAVFRLIQAAILGINLLNYLAAYWLLTGQLYYNDTGAGKLDEISLGLISLHGYGYDLGLIFFAVSTVFLGCLVTRSKYVPAYIGYGLIAAALVYVLGSFTHLVLPDYLPYIEPLYLVPFMVELSFCLWLLLKSKHIAE